MKRGWVWALLFSLLLGGVAGCTPSPSDDRTTIHFIHWRGEDKAVFDRLIQEFEKKNPTIQIEMNIYPSEPYQSTAQTLLRDGSTGDVFTAFPGSQFERMEQAGMFTDLTDDPVVDRFDDSLIKAGQKDGKQWALPYQLVFNQPVYNASLFAEKGWEEPQDWDGFLALCEEMKEEGIIPIAFPGADIGPGQLMNALLMNHAPEEDIMARLESGETKLTDAWWLNTLGNFKELTDNGYLQEDPLGTKHEGAIALFAQGKAAMLASGSYAMASVKEQNPEMTMKLLAPLTVPESDAVWEGIHTTTFMLAVNSRSQHPEEAKEWIRFLAEPEIAGTYANQTGQHLTVKDVAYTSDELKENEAWLTKKTRFQPRYLIQNAEIEKAVIGSIQDVIGGKEPKLAAREAQQIVNQHLE